MELPFTLDQVYPQQVVDLHHHFITIVDHLDSLDSYE